jgi:two-component system, NarL family, sensor histidine kinase UhpB
VSTVNALDGIVAARPPNNPNSQEYEKYHVASPALTGRPRGRKKTLRDVERRFRLLLENSYDGIVLMDADTTWHYLSPRAGVLLGQVSEQVLGQRGIELVHPDDLVSFDQCLRDVMGKSKRKRELSLRLRRGDGMWSLVTATFANYLSDPNVSAIICNFRVLASDGAEQVHPVPVQEPQSVSYLIEAARLDERKRIARELHDEFGSCLTVIKLYLGSIKKNGWRAESDLGVSLDELLDLVTSALKTVNNISTTLRPYVMENRTLWPAIEWLAGEVQRAAGIRCDVELDPNISAHEMNSDRSTLLFRVVQEGLTNVMKHAGASQVKIRALSMGNDVLLCIRDNGKGLDEANLRKADAWGIVGLRERLIALGGMLEIGTHDGGGTTLSVRLARD